MTEENQIEGMGFETAARYLGLAAWLFVGAPVWGQALVRGTSVPGIPPLPWSLLYGLFGVAFWAATDRRRALARGFGRRALVCVQGGLAAALAWLGMPHFEGALFALVAAQAPAVMPTSRAVVLAAWQGAFLLWVTVPSHGPLGATKAMAEYGAFALFALVMVRLRERAESLRRALDRTHAQVLAAQELLGQHARAAERLRISRELHDAVGHHLVGAILQLDLAGSVPEDHASGSVVRARQAVGDALHDMRIIVRGLRYDQDIDIASVLGALGRGVERPRVSVHVSELAGRSRPELAHVLLRCAQELVTNAARHAEASELALRLDVEGGVLVLRAEDDGRGSPGPQLGCGLLGIRERLEEASGELDVRTSPGKGFAVTIRLPLHREAA